MLKVKLVILVICGFLLAGLTGLKAQNLVIQTKDGAENTEQLSSIQKLSFSVSDLLVGFKNGTVDPYGLSTIQKLYFDQSTQLIEQDLVKNSKIIVFPNPATETITVNGMPVGDGIIAVFKPDGQLIFSESISTDRVTFSISSFTPGLYFLLAKGISYKFIKL